MSGKRIGPSGFPLCRRTYKDGRHCALPAHPDFDGLCYNHGTMRPRGSRNDNLRHELKPLLQYGFCESDIHHAMSAVSSAIAAQRIDNSRAAVLDSLSRILIDTDRACTEEQFRNASGPRWDRIRSLMDQLTPDEVSSNTNNVAEEPCAPRKTHDRR